MGSFFQEGALSGEQARVPEPSVRGAGTLLFGLVLSLLPALGCARHGDRSAPPVQHDAGGAGGAGHGGSSGMVAASGAGIAGETTALPLVVNEVVTSNTGVWVDETGATDDLIELTNIGDAPLDLGEFGLSDAAGEPVVLGPGTLDPGEYLVLWADGQPEQGAHHLPFKLSASGESLGLYQGKTLVWQLSVPALGADQAYARLPDGKGEFTPCRYATPGRANGSTCGPPPPPELSDEVTFSKVDIELPVAPPQGPLVLSEALLEPADFVEVHNLGDAPISLDDFVLRLAPTAPGTEYPGPDAGVLLGLPSGATLDPDERLVVNLSAADTEALDSGTFEGVLTVFARDSGEVSDRVEFVGWPSDAALARHPDARGPHAWCTTSTPGAANDPCDPLPERPVGDRLRHLRTPGDFDALADGGTELGMAPVKFVVDTQQGGAVHLLSSRAWALHYTFIREVMEGLSPLDRCDPEERAIFDEGWYRFSQEEYFDPYDRRYLLGTLVHHGPADLHTIEFALGDAITAVDMRSAFYRVMEHVPNPSVWALRPQDDSQAQTMLEIDGTVPIVGQNAPFAGVTMQPLSEGVGYGTLQYFPSDELDEAELGPDVIVVTDDVPNDIPLVGGLITEAFQTPLAHVNVLSQNRGTPNLALVDARHEERIEGLLGTLVRFEVISDGFTLAPASAEEARAFWDSRRPEMTGESPRLDLTVRDLVPLTDGGLEQAPFTGVKAAQLAELYRVPPPDRYGCPAELGFSLPERPFAIPVVHCVEHFSASGAEALLVDLQADPDFVADPSLRKEGLTRVRRAIQEHPVDPSLLSLVEAAIEERFGSRAVRFRSSSNAEDLPGFNGAGLYTSTSAQLGDPEQAVADALRTVWASLYNLRAYDERELAGIDHRTVAMGVLVHEAFVSERANGVAISRNLLDPTRSDIYYLNAQLGEASVTNPAPGVVTEQLTYTFPPRSPPLDYQSQSSLAGGEPVLSLAEVEAISCGLYAIDAHFRALLDPAGEMPWFAMEAEFKLLGPERRLLLKQARPHQFGGAEPVGDCREL